jgi:hypothetical protein
LVIHGAPFTPLDSDGTKLTPITYNGRTYLPLRAVAEATGLQVNWDNATRTATLGNIQDDKGMQVNTSMDKTFQISLPDSWIRNDPFFEKNINPLTQFGAIKKSNGNTYFLVVVAENKANLTIDDYRNLLVDQMQTKIDNSDVSPDHDLKVNGYTVKQFQIKGTIQQINGIYSIAIIETSNHFYTLNFWTAGNDINGIQNDITAITNSFKEIAG